MRGIGGDAPVKLQYRGITPACAGNSAQNKLIEAEDMGSPPRVRGIELGDRKGLSVVGITPACAGNRRSSFLRRLRI